VVFEEAESERAGTDNGTLNAIPSVNANAIEAHFVDANTSELPFLLEPTWEPHSPTPLNCTLEIVIFRTARRPLDKIQFNGVVGLRTYISLVGIGDQR